MSADTILFAAAIAAATAACGAPAGTLEVAREALGADTTRSLTIEGSGRWYQFGQSPGAALPWPAFDVSSYTAAFDYETPAARVQMTRLQVIEPGRARPAPVEQRNDAFVSGASAWNQPVAAPGASGASKSASWRSGRRRTAS